VIKNKTKKGQKIRVGYWESWSWKCAECGREWTTQHVASRCADRGHVNEVLFYYHDDIERPLNIEDYPEDGKIKEEKK